MLVPASRELKASPPDDDLGAGAVGFMPVGDRTPGVDVDEGVAWLGAGTEVK